MAKRDTDLSEQYGTEKDPAYDSLKAKQEHSEKAKNVLRGAGYARGGGVSPKRHSDEKEDKALVKKMMSKAKIKVKHGGKIDGKAAAHRADKYKRGGSVPHGHTKININVGSGQEEKKQALQAGMALGAKMAGAGRPMAGAPMQARAPMPGPSAPMSAPGGAPSMAKKGGRMYKRGGPVRVAGVPHLKGGAGGAKGRLSKMESYGTKPKA
jgi:hypothetical protein